MKNYCASSTSNERDKIRGDGTARLRVRSFVKIVTAGTRRQHSGTNEQDFWLAVVQNVPRVACWQSALLVDLFF